MMAVMRNGNARYERRSRTMHHSRVRVELQDLDGVMDIEAVTESEGDTDAVTEDEGDTVADTDVDMVTLEDTLLEGLSLGETLILLVTLGLLVRLAVTEPVTDVEGDKEAEVVGLRLCVAVTLDVDVLVADAEGSSVHAGNAPDQLPPLCWHARVELAATYAPGQA